MQKKIIVLLFLVNAIQTFGQQILSKGTDFQQNSTVNQAFKVAKSQHKPLFIEVYSPTCHICQSYIPVFEEKEVGDFYNKNFVNIKVDVNSSDFKEYFEGKQKIYVMSMPMLLFYDENENFMHHARLGMGQGKEMLLRQASIAIAPLQRSKNWKELYDSGTRGIDFLADYAIQCRLFRDTTSNIAAMNSLFEEFPKTDLNTPTSWYLCEKMVMDVDNGFFNYWINNLPNAKKFSNGYEKTYLENIIFTSIFSSRGANYSAEKLNYMNDYLTKLGYSKTEITRKTLLPITKALLKENQATRAAGDVNNYLKTTSPAATEYAYWTSVFTENAQDISYKSTAENWLKKALMSTKSPRDLAEIYYQCAKFYAKTGDIKETEKAKELALKNAKIAKLNLAKYNY